MNIDRVKLTQIGLTLCIVMVIAGISTGIVLGVKQGIVTVVRREIREMERTLPENKVYIYENSGFVKRADSVASAQRFGNDEYYWVRVVTEHGQAEFEIGERDDAMAFLKEYGKR